MRRINCPYLGLKDDPTTTLNFPSPGNFCHQARPVAPVKGAYQETHCLTTNHTACPLYQANRPMALPVAIAGRAAPTFTGRQVFAMVGVPFIIVAVAFFTYLWNNLGWGSWLAGPIPDTGAGIVESSFGLVGAGQPVSRTPFSPSVADASPQPTRNDCPLPAGWVAYTVKPTDSLFRLSVIYGVSVEDLQRVNCMGAQTVILPGQLIYIPYIATNTPMDSLPVDPQVLPTQTTEAAPPPRLPFATATQGQPAPTATGLPTSTPETPTAQPTVELPTALPTLPPIATSPVPTSISTQEPTALPTARPTRRPTRQPSPQPTPLPTIAPTAIPTDVPTALPTIEPTAVPTIEPSPILPTEPPPVVTTEPPPDIPTEPPPILTTEPAPPPTTEPPPEPTIEPTAEPQLLPTSELTTDPGSPMEPPPVDIPLPTLDFTEPVFFTTNTRVPASAYFQIAFLN